MSSRVVKTSAVDLLDEVLGEQNYSTVKTTQKGNAPASIKTNDRNSAAFNHNFSSNPNISNNKKNNGSDFN